MNTARMPFRPWERGHLCPRNAVRPLGVSRKRIAGKDARAPRIGYPRSISFVGPDLVSGRELPVWSPARTRPDARSGPTHRVTSDWDLEFYPTRLCLRQQTWQPALRETDEAGVIAQKLRKDSYCPVNRHQSGGSSLELLRFCDILRMTLHYGEAVAYYSPRLATTSPALGNPTIITQPQRGCLMTLP
jgi:hypothetical protein